MQALEGLLGLYEKMKTQISELLENDSIFNYELSNGMEIAFTQSSMVPNSILLHDGTPLSFPRGQGRIISKLLADYSNFLLVKGGQMSDKKTEAKMDLIVSCYSSVPDKDYFLICYMNLLAERLLSESSESIHFECSMITKLKIATGSEATAKMEGMISDMNNSMELYNGFLGKHSETQTSVSIRVLTGSFWPSGPAAVLPDDLMGLTTQFNAYYGNSANFTRKLVYDTVSGQVLLAFRPQPSKSHLLELRPIQAAILLLFNSVSSLEASLSAAFIQETLGMKQLDLVKKILETLTREKCPILKKTGISEYQVNQGFTSKLKRVKVAFVLSEEDDRTGFISSRIVL